MIKTSLLALALIPSLACADATLDYQVKTPDGNLTTTVYVSGAHVRIDTKGAERPVTMLYDSGSDETIMLDLEKKQYMEMGQVMQQAEAVSGMVQQAMKNVPPEQRAMVSKMMGRFGKGLDGVMKQPKAAPAPVAKFRKTGKTETVNGVRCEWAKRQSGSGKTSTFCLTDYDNLGLTSGDYATLKKFMRKGKEMASRASKMSGGMVNTNQMFDGSIEGLPVKSQDSSGTSMQLVSKKSGANPVGGFGIPAGYSPMAMPTIPR